MTSLDDGQVSRASFVAAAVRPFLTFLTAALFPFGEGGVIGSVFESWFKRWGALGYWLGPCAVG